VADQHCRHQHNQQQQHQHRKKFKMSYVKNVAGNFSQFVNVRFESWQVGEEVQVRVKVLGQQLLCHGRRVEVVLDVGVLLVDLLPQRHPVGEAAGVKLGQLLESEQNFVVIQLVLEPVLGRETLSGQIFDHKDGLIPGPAIRVVDEGTVAVGEAVVQGGDVKFDLISHTLFDKSL